MARRKLPFCGDSEQVYCLVVVDHHAKSSERLLFTTRQRFESARKHHGRNGVAAYRCDLVFRERLDAEPPLVMGPSHDRERGALGTAGWCIVLAALVLAAAIAIAFSKPSRDVSSRRARSRTSRACECLDFSFSPPSRVGCAGALVSLGARGPERDGVVAHAACPFTDISGAGGASTSLPTSFPFFHDRTAAARTSRERTH